MYKQSFRALHTMDFFFVNKFLLGGAFEDAKATRARRTL